MISDIRAFEILKEKIKASVGKSLNIHKDFSDWTMNDIHSFQDDLERKCKSSVSEKWIYTHLKNTQPKLPRVDVLNLLSIYSGFDSWSHFTSEHRKRTSPSTKKYLILSLIVSFSLMLLLFFMFEKNKLKALYFKDAYTREIIPFTKLNVKLFSLDGRAILKSNRVDATSVDSIQVNSPYYKGHTFYDFSNPNSDSLIFNLYPDDYSLMLNYFSRSKTNDWVNRRRQLNDILHNEAKLFHVHPQFQGLEMLNKEEFIDRLSLPINSLRNLEILDIEYKTGKIFRLRFIQNDKVHD